MSTKLSRSAERFSFQKQKYLERKIAEGKNETDPEVASAIDIFEEQASMQMKKEQNIEWSKNNMEYDLRTTNWILEKVRSSEVYSQNLYAAMCNNEFQKISFEDTPENIVHVLKDGPVIWSCSWRYAGGVIADMREEGDYIDWYCSGIRESYESETTERNYVSESVVTDEIKIDLEKIGWRVIQEEDV